jgi:hypothetical protein
MNPLKDVPPRCLCMCVSWSLKNLLWCTCHACAIRAVNRPSSQVDPPVFESLPACTYSASSNCIHCSQNLVLLFFQRVISHDHLSSDGDTAEPQNWPFGQAASRPQFLNTPPFSMNPSANDAHANPACNKSKTYRPEILNLQPLVYSIQFAGRVQTIMKHKGWFFSQLDGMKCLRRQ